MRPRAKTRNTLLPQQVGEWLKSQTVPAVVLYYRVSTSKQRNNGNFAWQEYCLTRYCEQHGIAILDEFYEACNGNGTDAATRPELTAALELAAVHGVPLLAASSDRYLRPAGFDKFDQSAQPDADEFAALEAFAGGVTLLTYLAPDASPEEVKALQRRQSHKARAAKQLPQPMRRDERKAALIDEVREMARWRLSPREIEAELEARGRPAVSQKSIWKWLQEAG